MNTHHHINRHHLGALAAGLLIAACEPERVEVAFPDRDAIEGVDAQTTALDAGASDGTFHADGTWLLFLQDRYCLFAAGAANDYLVWTWYLVEMSGAGPGAEPGQSYFRQRVRLCAEDQSPVTAGLVTYVPAEVTASLPAHAIDGFVLGNREGAQYLASELVDNWGLADSVGPDDPLPESADDTRVIDQDGDGKPGVSLVIGNNFCSLQLVQRTRYRVAGEVVNGHRVEGTFWSSVNKQVLGASLPLCASENALAPRPDGNRAVLVRVDGQNGGSNLDADGDGEVECAEIVAARDHLLEAGVVAKDTPEASRCR